MKSAFKPTGGQVLTDAPGTGQTFADHADTPSALPITSRTSPLLILKQVVSFPALFAALLVVALFVPMRSFTVDPDLWWHLKVGHDILTSHHWPTADTYSFTAPGAPWMAYEWLGETLLAAVQRARGLRGLLALDLAIGAAVVQALYGLAWLRSRNAKAAFVTCALFLNLTAVSFNLRPQMLGYLFLVVTLIILERFRQGHAGTMWLLPLLFLIWVNTHGSFLIGLLAFGVYAASGLVGIRRGGLESIRWTPVQRLQLGLVLLASLIALVVTPYGTKLAVYPLDMAFAQPINVASIQEWQSMPFNTLVGEQFLALWVGLLLAQIILGLTWPLPELILFLAGIVAACLHLRFIMLFVPFATPVFAVILSRWFSPYEPAKDKYALNALLMIAIVAGMVRFFPSEKQLQSRVSEHWPVKAVRYLEQHPPPRPMFNNYKYGGYLIYTLDGPNKVFIDGRGDIYERAGVFGDYRSISWIEPKALTLLGIYHIQSCLLERDEALGTLLAASPQWQKAYSDQLSVLFVRRQADLGAGR